MDKPSNLNERLTLVANIAVVLGIMFLALEMRQNTNMMRAQIRDSITEKQMSYLELVAATPHLAEAMDVGGFLGMEALDPTGRRMLASHLLAVFREWENSHYQYEQGLFSAEEYEARRSVWIAMMAGTQAARDVWSGVGDWHSPNFRAEVDAIVAEIEN